MPEVSEILNQLFIQNLTKEQFIAKYKELSETYSDSSIFLDNVSDETIGLMFDSFHSDNKTDTITSEDIERIKNYDNDNTSISENDLMIIYQKTFDGIASAFITNMQQELINSAENKKALIKQEIVNLEKEKEKKSKKQLDLYEKKQQEFEANKKQLADKQQKLADLTNIETQLSVEQSSYENETDEKNKEQIASTIYKLQSSYSSTKNTLTSEIKRLNKFILKNEKDLNSIQIKIDKKCSDINAKIKEKEQEIIDIDTQLQFDLEALLIEDLLTQETNRSIIENDINHKTGTRYSNIKGSFDASTIDFNKNNNAISFNSLEKNGFKYSLDKGQKLANIVANNSVGFTGYCSRYVSDALAESGYGNEREASAYQMASALTQNNNFQEISSDSINLNSLPAGCILVYDRGAAGYNSQHGHIEVTLGDGTACSDGRTSNIRATNRMRIFVPVENA